MKKESLINSTAIDFTLIDTAGKPNRLSDYRNNKNVVLVFNRGFA